MSRRQETGGTGFAGGLRQARQRLGWTQEELAARAGPSAHAISVPETGRRTPRASTVRQLAEALGLEPEDAERLLQAAAPQEAAAGTAVPRTPPAALGDFTGREAELRRAHALFAQLGVPEAATTAQLLYAKGVLTARQPGRSRGNRGGRKEGGPPVAARTVPPPPPGPSPESRAGPGPSPAGAVTNPGHEHGASVRPAPWR